MPSISTSRHFPWQLNRGGCSTYRTGIPVQTIQARPDLSNSSGFRIAPQVQHEHEEVHERLGVGVTLASYTRFGARRPPGLQYSSGGPGTG